MKWIILLFLAFGGAVYLGYIKVPPRNEILGNKADSPKASATALAITSNASRHSGAIRTASQNVLLPLESKASGGPEAIQRALTDLRTQITAQGDQREAAREAQALALLSQAWAERTAILARLQGSSTNHDPLDHVPG